MRYKQLIILLIIFASISNLSLAYDFKVDGICYNITSLSNLTVSVTRQNNDIYASDKYAGDILIPNQVTFDGRTYRVNSIDSYAFYYCSMLTSISIPENVTSIGARAFEGCTGLTKAEFASLECLCKIDYGYPNASPLDNAHHLYIRGELVIDLVIPNSVTAIGNGVFANCTDIKSVHIPESVTSIGSMTFYNCINLTSITIPKSVTSMVSGVFSGCTNLTSVTIDANVISSKRYLSEIFGSQVTEYIFGENVTNIGAYSCANCTSLNSITIHKNVTSIGNYAFSNCTKINNISCFATIIPSSNETVFYYVPISSASLHVPRIALEEYQSTEPWSNFGTVAALTDETLTEIKTIERDYSELDNPGLVFDMDGHKLTKMKSGLNIVYGKDGTGKKVLRR